MRKIVGIIFNLAYLLFGAAMIAVGTWLLVDPSAYHYDIITGADLDELYFRVSIYMLAGVGGFVIILATFGTIASCIDSKMILCVYTFLAVVAITLQFVILLFVGIFCSSLSNLAAISMSFDIKYWYGNEYSLDPLSRSWNDAQVYWECCGSYGYEDYYNSKFDENNSPQITVPWTCCVLKPYANKQVARIEHVLNYTMCQAEALSGSETYQYLHSDGCCREAVDKIDVLLPIILTIVGTGAFIQYIAGGVVGAGVAVVAFPVVLGGLGFTSAGVAAGSVAASIQTGFGGTIAAGSTFALAQSAGAAGVGIGTNIALAAGGAATGVASVAGVAAVVDPSND